MVCLSVLGLLIACGCPDASGQEITACQFPLSIGSSEKRPRSAPVGQVSPADFARDMLRTEGDSEHSMLLMAALQVLSRQGLPEDKALVEPLTRCAQTDVAAFAKSACQAVEMRWNPRPSEDRGSRE
jgi:hypothetical protein